MNNKPIIIVLIILLLILLGLVGGGLYLYSTGFFNQKKVALDHNGTKDANSTGVEYQADINEISLNIKTADGEDKMLNILLNISGTSSNIQDIIEANKPEIIDAISAQVADRSAEELMGIEGKNILKEDIIDDITKIIQNNKTIKESLEITKVNFTQFSIR